MGQDKQHEQALQATADSLMAEQQALQKRLQQLTLQYKGDANAVQQLQTGKEHRTGPNLNWILAPAATAVGLRVRDTCTHKKPVCHMCSRVCNTTCCLMWSLIVLCLLCLPAMSLVVLCLLCLPAMSLVVLCLLCLPASTEVDSTRADLQLRLSKLDLLHNAYRDALGLQLHSEDGKPVAHGNCGRCWCMCVAQCVAHIVLLSQSLQTC
jgi:hypothetical protein